MLDHSRGEAGERHATDVNALLEEYLNLAYHGMRARTDGLEVQLERDLDPGVGELVISAQEMGRVFINLLNNAFQAVLDRQGRESGAYAPVVSVSTRRLDAAVEVRVRDNGVGIPEHDRRKIFQPFFTTKPSGSGTGLGLSLSYEIVVQGYGGELTMTSTEGQGAEFVVSLPARNDATTAEAPD